MISILPAKNMIPFTYLVSLSLSSSATGQTTLTMDQDSDFELHYFLASTDQAAEATNISSNLFTVQIQTQTTGLLLSNARIPQRILTGNSYRQYLQQRPIVFPKGTVLNFDFLNLVAGTNVVSLGLVGYKILPGAYTN